jgi:hypothetical protein
MNSCSTNLNVRKEIENNLTHKLIILILTSLTLKK